MYWIHNEGKLVGAENLLESSIIKFTSTWSRYQKMVIFTN